MLLHRQHVLLHVILLYTSTEISSVCQHIIQNYAIVKGLVAGVKIECNTPERSCNILDLWLVAVGMNSETADSS